MREILQSNEDDSPNYDCLLLTSVEEKDGLQITRKVLRAQWSKLLDSPGDDVLFYFSGHGSPTKAGGYLVTQEGERGDLGLPMDELLTLANTSKARSALLILDCCYAGSLGNIPIFDNQSQLREGVTILAACRSTQQAFESRLDPETHGVFTKLVLGALSGGAADVRGCVSAAAIYAYAEQALGSWDQRPMYKSHADSLPPVRLCKPAVSDSLLRELPTIFEKESSVFRMAPSFERTHPSAKTKHVKLFDKFKILRNARLLTTQGKRDLFFLALESGWVKLTPLGQHYWYLAKKGRI